MRQKLFLSVALCLMCLFSARAQTVIESESNIVFVDKTANVSVTLENSEQNSDGKIELELLDAQNRIRAGASQNLNLKKGKETYKIALPVGDLLTTAGDEIAWFRLHYRVGRAEGFISLSELLKDVFELRVAAGENVFSGANYRVRVRAIQPFTNEAVKNVKVEGELTLDIDTEADEDELKLKAKGETDSEGFAVLDFKIPEGAKLDDDGDLKITGRKNGIVREFENDELETPNNEGSLFLTADKPIYQPGQSFNVRALYFDTTSTVVTDSELEFTVKDEDDTALYREKVKTSAFGIASIAWKIPGNAKLGGYRVEVEGDDAINGNTLYFKVSRYDLPQFAVVAKPDKTFYLPNQTNAEITVSADYLFGKPVTNGKVRLVEESERSWNWQAQKYDITEKQAFEGVTDGEGKYVAKVDLSAEFADLQESSWQRFDDIHFSAYFTDLTTNRTEQRRFDVRISKEPIHIYFIRKYNGELSQKLPVTAYVSTFYADGTPVVCDVEVKGKNDDDNKDSYKTFQRLKTNSLGAGKIEFSRPESMAASDDLDLRITARDEKGQTGTFDEELDYYSETDGIKIDTEKTIFRPGEPVKIKILSTRKKALVYLDIVKNWSVLESRFVRLDGDGRGEVKIPYNPSFKGDLTIAAYFEDKDSDEVYRSYDLIRDSVGIIFPEQQNLRLDAQFSAETYKPGEEAKARFSVLDGAGKPVESALGVVVFDKAVEERAKTDADFGGYFSRFRGWLGLERSFGGITLKDLNELDLSKPISAETQLAAEVILANNFYYPRIYRSKNWETNAESVYADFFKKQLAAVENVLKKQFEKDYAHPTDDASLRKILSENGINFDSLRDPWGNNYQATFTTEKTQNIVTLKTAGADKKFGSKDDFAVSSSGFAYFTPLGKAIDKAVADYHKQTGGYVRDWKTLASELAKQDLDLSKIKDHWKRDYQIIFEVSGRNYVIRFYSLGPNGYYEPTYYNRDDFDVWKSPIDYFAETDIAINRIFSQTVNGGTRPFPRDDAEFKQILKENGLDLSNIKDGYGQPVYLTFEKTPRYSDKTIVENGKQKITPVTEEVLTFRLRSNGERRYDGSDDFDLTSISGVLSEQSKDTKYETKGVKTIAFSGANGAIRGTVSDATGAVIPNATVTATNQEDNTKTYTAATKDDGTFLIENVPSGTYNVRIDAGGFKSSVYTGIQVRSQNLVEIRVTLEAGAISETVSVTAEESASIDPTDSKLSTNITSQVIDALPKGTAFTSLLKVKRNQNAATQTEENSTPRLREYFPETLFWSPEIITDRSGKAEVKFKMADNITTWKLYTVASTKNGKIGVAEKEVTAFQPFFVDLEPPKFLTEGDEIYLPTQVRNYTAAKQKVDVTMAKSDWFSFLSPEKQTIEVASGESENAVFGFKAVAPVKDGKQRVTAIAAKDSDAIEKPVTVRPNGQEIVRTESKLFTGSAAFDVEFPNNALPKTPKAELKIYPNLMAHVTESVEGLLQRPYGCGEQTISSTYPNLMILKFKAGAANPALEQKARKYLQKGYERLLGYQVADGGFSYWGGKDSSDVALTAYALRFLSDAKSFVEVDAKVIENAQNYLIKQQRADGSFTRKYYWETSEDAARTKLFTSYVARTLAMLKTEKSVLDKALVYLKTRNAEIDEPYALALYGLASLDAGNTETAREIAGNLEKMAISEGDKVYWNLETNTPFYGWGTAGRIETTALVLQLLIKTKDQNPKTEDLISKATMFLLKSKDRYGVWYSTQTTINVLDAFLASLSPSKNQTISVSLNGEKLKDIAVSADQIEPVVLDLTGKLANANRLEITSSDNSKVMSQIVKTHYIDWKDAEISNRSVNDSRAIRLDYKCDKLNAKIMETVTCAVETERIGFRGYGMLLAEIGLPPGAEVSRESLQAAMDADWSLSRYDVLPDRVVLYMWSKAGGTRFNFKFKPRYGITANTPASVVYDYYNEEAKGTVAPLKFEVK
jgi:uncharacterized protein YfaS (alpha-2-macroglobulin family)